MKTILQLLLLMIPILSSAKGRIVSISQDEITLTIHGLNDTVRVMHITDSHITIPNQADEVQMQYAQRMANAYKNTHHYKTGLPTVGYEVLAEQMQMAQKKRTDLIAFTGDIFNYPSATAVEFVKRKADSTGVPYLYVSGNHDWHMEGMHGSLDQLRKEWSESVLAPMFNGGNYLCRSKVIKGVNFVAIDNSTYQVNQEQLDFFRMQQKKGLPIVLLMHIPIYTPTSNDMVMGNPNWGAATDGGYQLERRERWSKAGNSQTTIDFVKEAIGTPNLTVLCGHTHVELLNVWNDMVQIAADISRKGCVRIIRFIPEN